MICADCPGWALRHRQHAPGTGRYSAEPVMMRPPGERLPAWSCRCDLPKSKRHVNPWDCGELTAAEAWRWRHPEATISDRGARALAWLEREFGRR